MFLLVRRFAPSLESRNISSTLVGTPRACKNVLGHRGGARERAMEFPFGHHHHHRHGPREVEEEEEAWRRGGPYYPPPGHDPYGPDAPAPPPIPWDEQYQPAPPPPPPYGWVVHPRPPPPPPPYGWEVHPPPPPPPPPRPPYGVGEGEDVGWEARRGAGYEPGPGYPAVQHVAHEVRPQGVEKKDPEEEVGGGGHGHGHGHTPVTHENSGSDGGAPTARPRTVRVFTKAGEDYSLSIRDGKVILARADHTDEYQHWIKDEKFSTKVKDEEGLPCFALVNKVTGEAIKHSIGATYPARLVSYNPDYLDESILWTESRDTGTEGFRCIRMVNNIHLSFDAFNGDDERGGVHDGTVVVLSKWIKGRNQNQNLRWKIVPY